MIRCQYDADTWVFQMDRHIRRPYHDAVSVTPAGIPFLRPELVLLYKALRAEPKDHADFDTAREHLTLDDRRWLAEAIQNIGGCDHAWLSMLRA